MDVNLLPDELRKKEEEELRRQASRPIEVPMSTPIKEAALPPSHSLSAAASPPPVVKKEEKKLPELKKESYIHHITPQGKIIHEEKSLSPALRRAGESWWRRLLNLLISLLRRPSPAFEPSVLKPPAPPFPSAPRPSSLPLSEKAKPVSAPAVEKEYGFTLEKKAPPASVSIPPPFPPKSVSIEAPKLALKPDDLPKEKAAASAAPPSPAPPAGASPVTPEKDLKPSGTPAPASSLGPPPLGINLLPPEWSWNLTVTFQFRRRVLLALVIIFAVSVLGSYAGSYIYISYQKKNLTELTRQRQEIESNIEKLGAQEAEWSALNSRLKLIAALLRNHIMVTPVFKFLEETVSPFVQYSSMSFQGDGTIAVEAETISYEEMARQIVSLRADQERVRQVTVGSFSFDDARQIVTFSLTISLKPEIWRYGQF